MGVFSSRGVNVIRVSKYPRHGDHHQGRGQDNRKLQDKAHGGSITRRLSSPNLERIAPSPEHGRRIPARRTRQARRYRSILGTPCEKRFSSVAVCTVGPWWATGVGTPIRWRIEFDSSQPHGAARWTDRPIRSGFLNYCELSRSGSAGRLRSVPSHRRLKTFGETPRRFLPQASRLLLGSR